MKPSLVLLWAAIMLVGCRKEEISSYSAPKEAASPVAAPKMPAMGGPSASAAPLSWKTPTGWEEQPASGMRAGSFTVTKDGQKADVSIIPLGGVAGSELDNVNRWRGQVGLPPIDAAKLASEAEKVTLAGKPAGLYDVAGTDAQSKQPTRILASILAAEGTTWFFKMVGPDALVTAQKPAFKEFLQSIQFGAASVTSPLPDGHPPINPAPKELVPAASAVAASADKPAWEVPAGWQEQPATSMRLATFSVAGENGAKADVSVVKLGGMAGGNLANVNRWRAQVGLQPVDEAGLEKLITTREVDGTKIILVDMSGRSVESGDSARLLAAIVPRAGTSWFYKMLGNDQLVAAQKQAFNKFVETARYSNAP